MKYKRKVNTIKFGTGSTPSVAVTARDNVITLGKIPSGFSGKIGDAMDEFSKNKESIKLEFYEEQSIDVVIEQLRRVKRNIQNKNWDFSTAC